jgi:RNA polymerase I-specific transcription initiation factor RRN3
LDWYAASDEVITAFSTFVGVLVSAHAVYAEEIMRNITRNFKGREEEEHEEEEEDEEGDEDGGGGGAAVDGDELEVLLADGEGNGAVPVDEEADDDEGEGEEEEEEEEDLDEYVRTRSCELLLEVLRIVPARSDILQRVLGENFPHKTVEKRVQANYIASLYAFTLSHPAVLARIVVPMAMDHLVQIDVQVDAGAGAGVVHPEEDDDIEEEEEDELQFEMEQEHQHHDRLSPAGDGSGMSSDEDEEDTEHAAGRELAGDDDVLADDGETAADKLDALMLLSFKFLRSVAPDTCTVVFEALWHGFDRTILRTYQSRHVQYLLFYFCGLHPHLAQTFLGRLLEHALSPTRDLVVRQAAIAYVASFVARAVASDMLCTMRSLKTLTNWIHGYIQQNPGEPNLLQHLGFYAVCQATFYMLCFRIGDLLAAEEGEAFIATLKLETMVSSRLKPLQIVLRHISSQFTKTMRTRGILYCEQYTRRSSVAGAWGEGAVVTHGDGVDGTQALEDFFPFDPYELHRSKGFLEGMYREWVGGVDVDVDESDSEAELAAHASEDDEDDFLPGSMSSGGGGGGGASFGSGRDRSSSTGSSGTGSFKAGRQHAVPWQQYIKDEIQKTGNGRASPRNMLGGHYGAGAAGAGGAGRMFAGVVDASPAMNVPFSKRSRSNSGSRRAVGLGGGSWGTPSSPAVGISRVRKAAP